MQGNRIIIETCCDETIKLKFNHRVHREHREKQLIKDFVAFYVVIFGREGSLLTRQRTAFTIQAVDLDGESSKEHKLCVLSKRK